MNLDEEPAPCNFLQQIEKMNEIIRQQQQQISYLMRQEKQQGEEEKEEEGEKLEQEDLANTINNGKLSFLSIFISTVVQVFLLLLYLLLPVLFSVTLNI